MAKYTKEQAIKIITDCAENYKNELVNKTLLFVCIDKHNHIVCYEFYFYSWNFMHLTGIKPKQHLSAADFYNKCLSHKLSSNDFEFSDDGTTHLKLEVLPSVICKNLSANMIGTYNSSKPRLYTDKIAGGIKACMGFIVDSVQEKYVPNTLLNEDARDNVHSYVRVVAVFRKDICKENYEELTYRAKKIKWHEIQFPKELDYLLPLIIQ